MSRVLIVDDDPEIARLLCLIAEAGGHVAECVPAAEAALARLDAERFDLLITDQVMPFMRGDALIRAVRARPGYAALPILAVTANWEPDVIAALTAAGADRVLGKPFPMRKLLDAMVDVLAARA